jgi:hypothetical protein|tara:strand:+ start:642 stop:923 length:282 start_codon:yes stop_codon:yes gene_type:complete
MTSAEEQNTYQNQDLIKDRVTSMTPKNLELFLKGVMKHLNRCTFTPGQFWEANHMINQLDYLLLGSEVKKGNKDEVRSDNTRSARNWENNNSA